MLREINEKEYKYLYKHMKRDFPANERPPYFAVKRNLKNGIFDGFFLLTTENGGEDLTGYAVVTAPKDSRFALITHLAVLPAHRNGGHGARLLNDVCGRYPERVMVLEVEDPAAAKTEDERYLCERRIRFYERLGFFVQKTSRAKIFGVDMLIMANTRELSSAREVMRAMYLPSFKSKKWLKFIDVAD